MIALFIAILLFSFFVITYLIIASKNEKQKLQQTNILLTKKRALSKKIREINKRIKSWDSLLEDERLKLLLDLKELNKEKQELESLYLSLKP